MPARRSLTAWEDECRQRLVPASRQLVRQRLRGPVTFNWPEMLQVKARERRSVAEGQETRTQSA
jgi:hypothetical protein